MAFQLGNFNIDEIVFGIAQSDANSGSQLLYTIDQLKNATIDVSSDSTEITDKYGNVVRRIYKTKSAEFSATNAFLNPYLMNAASGIDIKKAGAGANAITMPKVMYIKAGSTITLEGTDIVDDSVRVIGIYSTGGNSEPLRKDITASLANMTYAYTAGSDTIELPPATEGSGTDAIQGPVSYLVKYDRKVTSGWALENTAKSFPQSVCLTLYCSYVDPCSDKLKPCYVVLPSFQASPETSISLDSENQDMDFNGTVQMDYCGAEGILYYIYFPDEDMVKTVVGTGA